MVNDLKVNQELVNTSTELFQNVEAMNAYKKVRVLIGDKNVTEQISNSIIDKLEHKYVSKQNKIQLIKYI